MLMGLSFLWSTAFADVQGDLNNFFNNLGFSSNVTDPSVYQGQQAGYYNGGSIFARNAVRDVQIAQIDLPSYRAGCGGIDMYLGGMSFVNKDAFISMAKNILNSAGGYAFNLALESATPEIANVLKYIQDLANKINQSNVNSCEAAAGLVGSMWPKTAVAQKQVCEDIGTHQGIFDDWAAARQGCGADGNMSSTLSQANGAYKNMVLDQGNIAWKAIQQNSFLQNDTQLAELFLSLSGSVIVTKSGSGDDATNQFHNLDSLADSKTLIRGLLEGGTVTIWNCGDDTSADGCLSPTAQQITISADQSLGGQVRKVLNDIVQKIYSDQPLTKDEIGFLNSTSLPVYKLLNVQSAFDKSSSIVDVSAYADVISVDILFQYLNEALGIIKTSSGVLQYPEDIMDKFNKGVDVARQQVLEERKNAYSQASITMQMIQQTQTIEQMLAGTLSTNLMSSMTWASGLQST